MQIAFFNETFTRLMSGLMWLKSCGLMYVNRLNSRDISLKLGLWSNRSASKLVSLFLLNWYISIMLPNCFKCGFVINDRPLFEMCNALKFVNFPASAGRNVILDSLMLRKVICSKVTCSPFLTTIDETCKSGMSTVIGSSSFLHSCEPPEPVTRSYLIAEQIKVTSVTPHDVTSWVDAIAKKFTVNKNWMSFNTFILILMNLTQVVFIYIKPNQWSEKDWFLDEHFANYLYYTEYRSFVDKRRTLI